MEIKNTNDSKYFKRTILEVLSNLVSSKYFFITGFIIFVIMIIFFIIFNFLSYSIYSFFLLIGLILFKLYLLKNQITSDEINIKPIFIKTWSIIFFISLSLNILYLYFFESLYNKSIFYYITISICIVSLFLVAQNGNKKTKKYQIPLLAFILGLYIYLSNYIIFPYGLFASGDTHYQIYTIIQPIVETGCIPQDVKYTNFPLHQIYIASTSLISNMDINHLYRIIPGIFYAVGGLFVFSIGKKFKNEDYGIISLIIYLIAPHVIYQATHPYQFSYGLIIGIILLYIMTNLFSNWLLINKKSNINTVTQKWTILYFVFFITLTWTHLYTEILIFISMIIIFVGILLSIKSKKNDIKTYTSKFFNLFLISIVVFTSHLIYVSSQLPDVIRSLRVYYYTLLSMENYQIGVANSLEKGIINPIPNLLFNHIGIGLIMMLSIIGLLYGLKKKKIYVFICGIFWVFLFGLKSFGDLSDLIILVGDRVYTFLWITGLIFLSAYGFYLLIKLLTGKRKVIAYGLIFILAFMLLGNQYAGDENNLLKGEIPYTKFYYTDTDKQISSWLQRSTINNSTIYVTEEWRFQYLDKEVNRSYRHIPISITDNIIFEDVGPGGYLVLQKSDNLIGFRVNKLVGSNYIMDRKIRMNTKDFENAESHFSCLYDNYAIKIYMV